MTEKISAVYKIINTITGDCYIGSSKDVKQRWACHKCKSTWKRHSNNPMYLDMQKQGVDKFIFQILEEAEEAEESFLKVAEQQFIETLKPTYNDRNANGWDIERRKKYHNQLCSYNGETITINTLRARFRKSGIPHPTAEAKKYLVL